MKAIRRTTLENKSKENYEMMAWRNGLELDEWVR